MKRSTTPFLVSRVQRPALLAALLALVPACDSTIRPTLTAELAGEAALTSTLGGDRLRGTATLTLARGEDAGEPLSATVVRMSAITGALRPVFVADDPTPIELSPGEQTTVTFHFEAEAGVSGPPRSPWSLVCGLTAPGFTPETFAVTADIATTTRQEVTISGDVVLTRLPSPDRPTPAHLGAAWSKPLALGRDLTATGAAIDAAGNVLVVGTGGVSAGPGVATFLARLAPGGELAPPVTLSVGASTANVASGGAASVVAGTFSGPTVILGKAVGTPPDRAGLYVVRVDPGGAPAWLASFSGETNLYFSRIVVDTAGNTTVAGLFFGTAPFDLGGGPLDGKADRGAFVLGLDPAGAFRFARRIDGVQTVDGMSVDGSGAFVLTGLFTGAVDFAGATLVTGDPSAPYAVKLDAGGFNLWSRDLGPSMVGPTVASDAAGTTVVAGELGVLKLDAAGEVVWKRDIYEMAGGKRNDAMVPSSVAIDDQGRILVTGTFHRVGTFLGIPLGDVGESGAQFLGELGGDGVTKRADAYACTAGGGGGSWLAHRAGIPGTALVASFAGLAALDQGLIESEGRFDAMVAMLVP